MRDILVLYADFGKVLGNDKVLESLFYDLRIPKPPAVWDYWRACCKGQISDREFFQIVVNGTRYQGRLEEVLTKAKEHVVLDDAVFGLLAHAPVPVRGVISNHSRFFGNCMRERLGLHEYFDPMIISAECGKAKPQKEIWELGEREAVRRLARRGYPRPTPEQFLLVDDQPENVCGARTFGWKAIEYHSPGQLIAELSQYGLVRGAYDRVCYERADLAAMDLVGQVLQKQGSWSSYRRKR